MTISLVDWAIPRLEALYVMVDRTYAEFVTAQGLSCGQCGQASCCRVDLMIHTHIEQAYLMHGIAGLTSKHRREALDRCVALEASQPEDRGCALRGGGACRVYPWRPLICRLAGPLYIIRYPDGRVREGDGCPQLMSASPNRGAPPMDRTPLFREMSLLEREVVNRIGARARPTTISRMALDACGPSPGGVLVD